MPQSSGVRMENNVLIVTLDAQTSDREEIDITKLAQSVRTQIETKKKEIFTAESGDTYSIDSVLNIPSLGINYPVIDKTTDELLKISLTKYYGPKANEKGNYVIVGHNYRNKKMFGKLAEIKMGDIVEVTDLKGRTLSYAVYDRYVVEPEDTRCTSQDTKGKKEITLITCTYYGTQRLVIKAKKVD